MRYPVKQSYTCAAANLIGFASNVTGATWTLTANTAGDGLAHLVTIRNDTVNDHSGKTITLTGINADGIAITETLAGPGISATVTSTKAYKQLTTITVSATIGADTFDIGWSAVAFSPWINFDFHAKPFSASAAVFVGGTINFDLQHTYNEDDDLSTSSTFTALSGQTVNAEKAYTAPVVAVRAKVNSHTSGTFELYVLQGER